MMNNKVLIKLFVPELDVSFDCFVPVNELIWKIKILLVKAVTDLTNTDYGKRQNYILINRNTSEVYPNNVTLIQTNIRNASELILMSE